MDYVKIGDVKVSRFIVGSNPFSGFSHLTPDVDSEMKHYFTATQIKAILRDAEVLGVNTMLGRVDHHILRVLLEYWDEGGKLQFFAQTCPEVGNHEACVSRAAGGGAKACHIHGGIMDNLLAQKKLDEIPAVIQSIRKHGMKAGIAGHNPAVFEWAEKNLDVDYYMCSYYNSAHRDQKAEHVSGMKEWFLEEDRRIMTALIQKLSRPVIHYKIMAAGRNKPAEAFAFAAKSMRPGDAVCVGVFPKHHTSMVKEDVELLAKSLAACKR